MEYESVPLPTHEVTQAVPLEARLVGRRTERKSVPFYDGIDGVELATQPRSHRKQWTDAQWGAFEEYRRAEAEQSRGDSPVASAVVIKSARTSGVTDQS